MISIRHFIGQNCYYRNTRKLLELNGKISINLSTKATTCIIILSILQVCPNITLNNYKIASRIYIIMCKENNVCSIQLCSKLPNKMVDRNHKLNDNNNYYNYNNYY